MKRKYLREGQALISKKFLCLRIFFIVLAYKILFHNKKRTNLNTRKINMFLSPQYNDIFQ